MSVKIGEASYEWLLLHIRNGEQLMGLVEVLKSDADPEGKEDQRAMAISILQTKTGQCDKIVTVRSPHQIMTSAGPNGMQVAPMPLSLGNKIIFLRTGEILYVQFMDAASPLVRKIMEAITGIVAPGVPGESRTEGGLVIPGGAKP